MLEFQFQEMFPLGPDETPYRQLTSDHVGTASLDGERVLTVAPEAAQPPSESGAKVVALETFRKK